MNIELIKEVASSLGTTSEYIVGAYSEWHFVSSVVLILLGLVIMGVGKSVNTQAIAEVYDETAGYVLKYLIYFVGSLFIVMYIPDLFNSDAIAIHQLIMDIRG